MNPDILFLRDKSVLFAEDDNIARAQMGDMLEMLFGAVYLAKNGEEAYSIYEEKKPDLILTDIKMPRCDGLKLSRKIRQNDYETPVIVLTSFAEQELLLDAANLSIDGYLIKPVEFDSLIETLCKAIKRNNKNIGMIRFPNEIYYNTATSELHQGNTLIPLGAKEQELLELLIGSMGKTITKEEIVRELWLFEPVCESALKNIILRLRKKIGEESILSVRSVGYRLNIVQTESVKR